MAKDHTDTLPPEGEATRLLVVGAGAAGRALVEQLQQSGLPVVPVAFVDDDPALIGTDVLGLPVHGGTPEVVEIARRVQAREVLLAIPSSGGRLVRRLILECKGAGLPVRIVPGVRDIIRGDVTISQISEVKPEHLLGRETVDFNVDRARKLVTGRTVMVTGAGGSIGGELCRQILPLEPAELILLGRGENSIFEIAGELATANRGTLIRQIIADVRDAGRLEVLARRHQPSLILHAAAHKHVPLMEENPEEAVLVNIGGTANMIRFARRVGAERFVLISTDKAVAPSSIMGATKKVAELLVARAAARQDSTRFMSVRFGNVLGSRGSVVPFFMKRIESGLPLPVTHEEMTRFFMTIKEAAQLVVEAMLLGDSGATYILEMGNPVPIIDLARNLLALSGFDPAGGDEGPGITVTGLRPGEKLHEVLHESHETLMASDHPLIMKAEGSGQEIERVLEAVDELLDLAQRGRVAPLRELLAEVLNQPGLALAASGKES